MNLSHWRKKAFLVEDFLRGRRKGTRHLDFEQVGSLAVGPGVGQRKGPDLVVLENPSVVELKLGTNVLDEGSLEHLLDLVVGLVHGSGVRVFSLLLELGEHEVDVLAVKDQEALEVFVVIGNELVPLEREFEADFFVIYIHDADQGLAQFVDLNDVIKAQQNDHVEGNVLEDLSLLVFDRVEHQGLQQLPNLFPVHVVNREFLRNQVYSFGKHADEVLDEHLRLLVVEEENALGVVGSVELVGLPNFLEQDFQLDFEDPALDVERNVGPKGL